MTDGVPRTIATASVDETLALGARLGQLLWPQAVIALTGTLGSGKTHFVKGVARGAAVPPHVMVNSPTFVLVNEYPGRLNLHHIDVYRLHGADDLEALGFQEMMDSGGAVLVEWADRVPESLPSERLDITIEITGETARRFHCTAYGEQAERALALLAAT